MRPVYLSATLFLAPIAISAILLTIATGRSAPLPAEYPALQRTPLLVLLYLQCGTAACAFHLARKHTQRTALRQAAALHELEKQYHLLADHATDLIVVVRLDGSIRYVSPSVHAMLGYDPTTLIGRNALEYVHPDDQPAIRRSRAGTLSSGAAQIRIRVQHAHGTWHWVEVACFRNDTDVQHEIVCVGRDISEQQRLEADLDHLRRLDSVGRIAGPVMHDVNNCLTGIGGVAALALEALPSGHQLRDDLEAIGHVADRASALAHQLLSFTRKSTSAPQKLDLNAVLQRLGPLLRPLVGPNIACALVPAPDLASIMGNAAELEQVVLNLVLNARDAMPGGGELRIETMNVLMPEATAGACIRLIVSDTGIGMDTATQARIFEPYFTTRAPGCGFGLGLTTCAEIVKRHHGSMRVASALGRGTTITIDLPCSNDERDVQSCAATITQAQGDLDILTENV